ncbi:hypothetical protein BH24ACT4_BH24ACT4_04550 [soil metagenome]
MSAAAPSTRPRATGSEERPRPRARVTTRRQRSAIVTLVVAVSAVGGALTGARPTDLLAVDVLLAAGLAALVPWCSAHARRWTWCWLAGIAAVAAVDRWIPFLLAAAALVLALLSTLPRRRHRIAGAVVGALAIQALMRIGDVGPLGVPALVCAVAVIPAIVSGHRLMPRRHRRSLTRAAVAALVVAIVGTASAAAVVLAVRSQLVTAVDRSEDAVAGVGDGEREGSLADLEAAGADFGDARSLLGSPLLWPARALPIVGPHVGALHELAASGEDLTGAAAADLSLVDYDRLRYESGRINLEEVEAVAPALRSIRTALVDAEDRTGALDSPWLVAPLTDRVDELRERLIDTRRQADTAAVAIDLAPEMLGAEGPRRYLVVFPTESETRGGGGFVGNFVILDAVDGEVELTESARIVDMIDARKPGERSLTEVEGLEEYVRQYGELRPQDFNQDILYSPHFPSNARAFASVAEQSGRGQIEAVISMSPSGLAALLSLTGPVPVQGRDQPLAPAEAEQFLQLGQYLEYDDDEARSDALEGLTREVFDRLTTGSLPSPRELGEQLGPLVPTGALEMWSARPEEEDLLARLDVTGELPVAGAHDLVHVSGTNGGQNKIDVFLQRTVEVEPSRDPETGEIVSTVRVTLRNDAPVDGLPRYVIGNNRGDPPGTNRHLLSVFTPLMLAAANVDGVPVGVDAGRERGYQVYRRYLVVPPGAMMTFELQLRGDIPGMDEYRLLLPAQPMVNPDQVEVTGPLVAGEQDLTLDRDRSLVGSSG